MAEIKRFSNEDWEEIVSVISTAFGMDEARAAKLLVNPTTKLIAAIPYLAGCREPERTALAHLATYIVAGSEGGKAIFDHKSGDDYDALARLATGAAFEGGDPAIIDRGMKLLSYIMIKGYVRDKDSDADAGIYNVVGAGRWDADEMLGCLLRSILAVECAEMDSIVDTRSLQGTWWEIG